MGYLEDFKTQINNRDFAKFMVLWEEYSSSDHVETEEFVQLLKSIKASDFAKMFGNYIESALPLWKTFQDPNDSYLVLKCLIDLQTTNTPALAELALDALTQRYGKQPEFNERLRLIGLRTKENFQGALSHYDLLSHIKEGKFVYHNGGWGTGEIIEISPIREQMAVEFENVSGRKHITFSNAFKTLIPLPDEHFFARRFADPDKLEKEAKAEPLEIVKVLLRDLGPKTAAEIKDELCELVIPEGDWTKWWQTARTKLKKDAMVQTPDSLKDPFILRKTEVSQEERMSRAFHKKTDIDEIIQTSYNFVRDLPKAAKKQEVNNTLKSRLLDLLNDPNLTKAQELQVLILLEDYFSHPLPENPLKDFIRKIKDEKVEEIINAIEIVAVKKKALSLVREGYNDWIPYFCSFLQSVHQGTLRDYILKELNQGDAKKSLLQLLEKVLEKPTLNPELFFWYFQKIAGADSQEIPYNDKAGQCLFLESFFILLNAVETKPEYKDLTKKMYNLVLAKRYAIVRSIIENTSLPFLKEFLLLTSKCQTFTDHDQKILRSLAEVVQPTLAAAKPRRGTYDNTIWTTEAGYLKTQERAKIVGTVEILENAREIEAARALGDLRENSEYKFALEKRSRLQGELKTLSDQLSHARLITPDDISPNEVGIGNVVTIEDSSNNKTSYSILGPWEANPDENILSFQSKFAQAMCGLKKGETFNFRDEEYKILEVKSYLNK